MRSNSDRETKWYSTPSVSPGRGRRVVTETDSHTEGWWRRISATTLPLPTPDGPESTVRRAASEPAGVSSPSGSAPTGSSATTGVGAELLQQGPALVVPQPTDPAALRDLELFHHL